MSYNEPRTPAPASAPAASAGSSAAAPARAIREAAVLYGRGEWRGAEQLCRSVLSGEPGNIAALSLLGIIAAQTQRLEEAAELLGRAVALRPQEAAAHGNYGNVLRRLGRVDEALASYDRALKLQPLDAECHYLRGNALQDSGQLAQALTSYERALAIRPDYAQACNAGGMVLARLGRFEEALEAYARALRIRPDYAEAHNNRGAALHDLRRFAEALQCYDRALALQPGHVEAYYNRATTLRIAGRLTEALADYDRALAIRPAYAEASNNRGVVLQGLKRYSEALQSYERALQLSADYAEALNNRGATLHALQRYEEALQSYARALTVKSDDVAAWVNRALTLQALGRYDEALDSYARALALAPESAASHHNRGVALHELRRYGEALESYERALSIEPGNAEAHCNRGVTLHSLGRAAEALESYELALRLQPRYATAWYSRGNALRDLGRTAEAPESYRQALALEPLHPWLFGTWLHSRMQLCDWEALPSLLKELSDRIEQDRQPTPPLAAVTLLDSPPLQRRVAQAWVQQICPGGAAAPPLPPRGARLRIGYYSADFHDHATAHLASELFETHDRERFEVLGFSFGPERQDAARRRLRTAFDDFLEVGGRSDQEIVQLSRELRIDIAVDLKGFTHGQRTGIFAARAAPIQVSYLGYPGTMGARYIDYLIADDTLIPAHCREHYAERIVFLPHSYQANDRKRAIAATELTRAELGLPASGFVFCCFNSPYKITPGVFDSWMRILAQVDGSILWLLKDSEPAERNLRREAQARGVRVERLVFAPRMGLAEHLARHRAADLFLDTLPCNAHTTASDALWAGLPLLTRSGESFAARVAASLLRALGLEELITATPAEYEALAVQLALEPARLTELRARLHAHRSTAPLFDTGRLTASLERAYLEMYARAAAGLAPQDIRVQC